MRGQHSRVNRVFHVSFPFRKLQELKAQFGLIALNFTFWYFFKEFKKVPVKYGPKANWTGSPYIYSFCLVLFPDSYSLMKIS